jgi:hypothetical protein
MRWMLMVLVLGVAPAASADSDVQIQAGALYLTDCQRGVIGATFGIGGESRVCELLRIAMAANELGQTDMARTALEEALREARLIDTNRMARLSRWIYRNITQPAFGILPFVGKDA